ncbi:hypothetical protein D3C75_1107220 [compost metagenome]
MRLQLSLPDVVAGLLQRPGIYIDPCNPALVLFGQLNRCSAHIAGHFEHLTVLAKIGVFDQPVRGGNAAGAQPFFTQLGQKIMPDFLFHRF